MLRIDPKEVEDTMLLPTILERRAETDKLGILFYLGKMYTGQLRKGEPYEKLKKCIHVSILDFIYFPDDNECYRTIHFRDDKTGEVYTDLMEIQIMELKKLPGKVEKEEDILEWMRFLGGKSREEFEYMAKANEYLDEAYRELINMSVDEKKRLEYEEREKALRDYNSQMSSSFRRGEEQTKRIFKLYMQGKSPKEIAEICKISLEKVMEILE